MPLGYKKTMPNALKGINVVEEKASDLLGTMFG